MSHRILDCCQFLYSVIFLNTNSLFIQEIFMIECSNAILYIPGKNDLPRPSLVSVISSGE